MEDMSAMHYEFVIRRAFNCNRFQKGADADIFRRLTEDEYCYKEKPVDRKLEKVYNNVLDKVKLNLVLALEQALKILLKRKEGQDNIDIFLDKISVIKECNDSKSLSKCIDDILKDFGTFKIEMS